MITYSQEGLDFIKQQEGFNPRPVKNHRGDTVIGYGHLLAKCSDFGDTPLNEEGGETMTEEEASKQLLIDLIMPVKEIRQLLQLIEIHAFFGSWNREDKPNWYWLKSYELIQNRFDALLSIRNSMEKSEFGTSDFFVSLYLGRSDEEIERNLKRLIYVPNPKNRDRKMVSDYLVQRRAREAELMFREAKLSREEADDLYNTF